MSALLVFLLGAMCGAGSTLICVQTFGRDRVGQGGPPRRNPSE